MLIDSDAEALLDRVIDDLKRIRGNTASLQAIDRLPAQPSHEQLNLVHTALFGWPIDHLTPVDALSQCRTLHDVAILLLRSDRLRWDPRDRVPLWPHDRWVCTDFEMFRIWINLHDSFIAYGILHDDWEQHEGAFMRRVLAKGDHMIDVGANVGVFTLRAADAVGPTGRVFGFEPQADIFKMLKRTVADNGFGDRVELRNVAVGDSDQAVRIWRHQHNNPGASMILARDVEAIGSSEIPMVKLDQIEFSKRISFVKIDIEGFEPKFLVGAQRFMTDHKPIVLTEYFPNSLRAATGGRPADYLLQWAELGFRTYHLDNDRLGPEFDPAQADEFDTISEPFNVVCVPIGASVSGL